MVARRNYDGDPRFGEVVQRFVRHIHNRLVHAGAKEKIAAVNDEVGPRGSCVVENPLVVVEEVRSPPALLHPGTHGVVEPQMRVC